MSPSLWQIIIVVGIIVLLFGAKRIPDLGKSLGQAIRGFKDGINEDEAIDVTESSKEQISQQEGEQKKTETKTEKQES